MTLPDIVMQLLSGISYGMLLFLVASGLTLVFGVLRVTNFAHGSFYMIAAFAAYSITTAVGGGMAGFLLSLVLAPLLVAFVGLVVEVAFLRRIQGRPHFYQLILTYGLTLVFADLVRLIWGSEFRSVNRPPALAGSVEIFDRPFPTYTLAVLAAGLIIAAGLWFVLQRTKFGRTVRAIVSDPEMVGALGINVPRTATTVFVVAAWLAGIGGALAAPIGSIGLGMDNAIIVEAFAIVIIGGVGDVRGALLGALIIGLLHSTGILFAPRLAIAFTFIALCLVLLLRPRGLMNVRSN